MKTKFMRKITLKNTKKEESKKKQGKKPKSNLVLISGF